MPYYNLEPCSGQPCPRCGCTDTTSLRTQTHEARVFRGGEFAEEIVRLTERRACRHCGHQWIHRSQRPAAEANAAEPLTTAFERLTMAEPPDLETASRPACPHCGHDMIVTSTRKSMRYHKCPDCGATAKTPK